MSTLACDVKGQDMIEYALMAGFVAIADAALIPEVTGSFSSIFSKITSVMDASVAGSSGG
jgi:Flp pilus assembly pilin Flp